MNCSPVVPLDALAARDTTKSIRIQVSLLNRFGIGDAVMALADAKERRQWRVTGMDCASCAGKIQGALEKLKGVGDVDVAVMAGRVTVEVEPGGDVQTIETSIVRLGYGVTAIDGDRSDEPGVEITGDHGHNHGVATEPGKPWHRTHKGRLVIVTGVLLAAAWVADLSLPVGHETSYWAFVIACSIGLIPVAQRAFRALVAGVVFTIEMLMTIAATGALFIGAAEEAALVVFLFAVGELLEGVAATKARMSIRALADLIPNTAVVEVAGVTQVIAAADVHVGQIVVVKPGDRIPVDGEIIDGMSGIDESPVTGESVPRNKGPGDSAFAGSINAEATLRIRATTPASDNTIARVIKLVEEAESARAPTERFIDRFSRYYMPGIVAVSILVALVPPLALGGDWQTWIYRSLALLLIGCPCALVISVPASMASSLSSGARSGLLVKGGAVIEAIAAATHVAFDKTGTLTAGHPKVIDVVPFATDESSLLAIAAGVEQGSNHPLAEAIVARTESEGISPRAARAQSALPGKGVKAMVEGQLTWVASPRFATEQNMLDAAALSQVTALEADGKTVVVVLHNGTALGLIAMRDEPREDAGSGVSKLLDLGISSIMLTGDNTRTAAAIAGQMNMEYRAELLPDGKVAVLKELASQHNIMMVGDGINDAPALAAAQVGVAMGSGTGVALETADAALMRNRVSDVAAVVRLARATMANIWQNVSIALGLKGVFLITTMFGMTGLWLAIIADTGATVLVTLNALRLLSFKPENAVKGNRRIARRSVRLEECTRSFLVGGVSKQTD